MKKTKFFVSILVFSVVFLLGASLSKASYQLVAGDLVKTSESPAVYYINSEGQRQLFPNSKIFWTWYDGSWSSLKYGDSDVSIKTISTDDFEKISLGKNITARPGVNLVKFNNNSKVYAVAPGAVLQEVASSRGDEVAVAIYGQDYQDRIITIQNAFENNYEVGEKLMVNSSLPSGSLVKKEDSDQVYYIEDGKRRMISNVVMKLNGLKDSAVITINSLNNYLEESEIIDIIDSISLSSDIDINTILSSLEKINDNIITWVEEGDYDKVLSVIDGIEDISSRESYLSIFTNWFVLMGEYDYAIAGAQKLVALNPDYISYTVLAETYMYNKEFDKAEEYLLKSIALNDQYYISHSDLGVLYLNTNRYDLAEQEFNLAMDINALSPIPYYNLGVLYQELDNIEEARNFLASAVVINSTYGGLTYSLIADTYYRLGYLSGLAGDNDRAVSFLTLYLLMNPDDVDAQELLDSYSN